MPSSRKSSSSPDAAPEQSAKDAGLRYVSDRQPGIARRRHGRSFRYIDPDGKPVRDAATIARIRSLVIPPAWRDVWICTSPNGHLQVTGRDARGRKQSRYHPRWREVRDETKYERMLDFGSTLPQVRAKVEEDLSQPGLSRTKVLATIVRLMETTSIRVGNEEYARTNHSYGLTTMRNRHVKVAGSAIEFHFEGKSGVKHTIDIHDRRLAKIVQRCQDIPGYELFQYLENDGTRHSIDSADVNEYLRSISGKDFTAKDFRTWAGTVTACRLLRETEPFEHESDAKKNVVQAIKTVAAHLGNTPSVCRKCYVHPAVLESYFDGAMPAIFTRRMPSKFSKACKTLQRDERALIQLLHRSLRASQRRPAPGAHPGKHVIA